MESSACGAAGEKFPAGPDGNVELPRTRFLVVAGIFVLAWILYIDRAAISTAKGAIASELNLSDQAMRTLSPS